VHFTDSIGERKVDSARRTLSRINPQTLVSAIAERVPVNGWNSWCSPRM